MCPRAIRRSTSTKEAADEELHQAIGLAAAGEIAEQLFLSTRTVETHRSRIQQKTRSGSRAELVRYAFQHGLVDL